MSQVTTAVVVMTCDMWAEVINTRIHTLICWLCVFSSYSQDFGGMSRHFFLFFFTLLCSRLFKVGNKRY